MRWELWRERFREIMWNKALGEESREVMRKADEAMGRE